MPAPLLETAYLIKGLASGCGAEASRVLLSREASVSLNQANQALESVEESDNYELNLQLYVEGKYSRHTTSDLRPEALKTFVQNAVTLTRFLSPDPNYGLPESSVYTRYQAQDLKLNDGGAGVLSKEVQKSTVEKLEASVLHHTDALQKAGARMDHSEAGYFESQVESILLNSNGFESTRRLSLYGYSVDLTVSTANGKKVREGDSVQARLASDLPSIEAIAENGVNRTLRSLGATPLRTQKLPMIVENRVVGRLLNSLVNAMTAGAVQQRSSFLEGMRDKQLFSPTFTVIDQPFLPSGMASRLCDGEGIPAVTRTMIDQGVLREFWTDTYYGRKLGWQPTNGSPSNLLLPVGSRTLPELMQSVGKGILVTGFLGGNSNPTTGDFSFGIRGVYFENGQRVQAVQEMNIAGNHLELWRRLTETGSDVYRYSSTRSPSLVFSEMVFSGV